MSSAGRRVEVLEKRTVYQGHYRVDRYRLRHEKFDGGWTEKLTREVFERGHAVALLPYDAVRDRVILVEQFRIGAHAAGRSAWLVEIVAGLIEEGETPEDVARRECEEECGCKIERLVPIGTLMPSAGALSETVAFFCGKVDSAHAKAHGGAAGEGEDVRVFSLAWSEAAKRLAAADFTSATAVIALQWLALNRERIRKEWLP
jgi:ADP-ribose pyrophosphatase